MKKTLVALAAVAATASFAQSSVTLTGNFDFAAVSKSGSIARANGTTVTTGNGTSSTSTIKITATEDLGGGLKVTGLYEIDPRPWADDAMSFTSVANTGSTAGATSAINSTITGLTRGDAYIQLSGGMGSVQLGAFTTFGLAVSGLGSPLGTAIGSGYTFNGISGSGINSFVSTRSTGRSVKITSASMNGFSVGILHTPGNDQALASTIAGTTGTLSIPNARALTEFNLNYSKGPLNLGFVNISQPAQTNNSGYFASSTTTGAGAATSTNIYGGNYNVGNITVYGAVFNGQALAAASSPSTIGGWRGGVKFTMGKIDLIGQYNEVRTTASSSETKASTTGARVDYNLSKTAAAYLGMEKHDSGATSANQLDMVSVGLRKSF